MRYLTLGTVWKDEHEYALDFIKLHYYLGVEHFVIFDREYHKLYDMTKHLPYVEIIHFPETPENIHMEGFGRLIKYNKGKTKWLACIDCDQVLVPVKTNDVREVLKDYEEFASLQINWHTFGSSYKETKEPGSIYERFLLRGPDNVIYDLHTQFICQPDRTLAERTKEPHYPLLPEGEISVNTNKEQIDPNKSVSLNPSTPLSFNYPALHDILWVAHYNNKSKEEFIAKNNKGRADIHGAKIPMEQFEEYDRYCNLVEEKRVLELWKLANL